MTIKEIESNIQKIAEISVEVKKIISNNDSLFDFIEALPIAVKQGLKKQYDNDSGPINKLRKEVANETIIGKIDRQKIINDFTVAKRETPKLFTTYKNLFNIFYPFVVYQNNSIVYDTLTELGNLLRNDLGFLEITNLKVVGFDGARNTGDEHAWLAIYNYTHLSQQTAIQLFFSIKQGTIKCALYDPPHDKIIAEEIIIPSEFEYEFILNFYQIHKQIILQDNFRASMLKKYPIEKLIDELNLGNINSWLIKPGQKGSMWKRALKEENIRIGWGEVVREVLDNNNFSEEFVLEKLNEHYPKDTIQHNNKISIISFMKEVKPNDIVFAVSGISEVIGVGVVTGELILDEEDEEYTATHNIDWLIDLIIKPYNPSFSLPIKTVTDLNAKNSIELLNRIFEINQTHSDKRNNSMDTLNTILYGPPGTGKTYHTIESAIKISNPRFSFPSDPHGVEGRRLVKKEYERLVKEGKIAFITFHQSLSYEDFIEGIKPKTFDGKVIYEIEDGLFKSFCNKARFINGNFESVIEKFKTDISEEDGKTELTIKSTATSFDIIYRGTNVFYVQPHSSKKENPWYPVNIDNIRKAFETDSFQGIYNPTYVREVIDYLKKNYSLIKGNKMEGEIKENYVLIIDEINRGNISQIFGELITLIEVDKREGRKEELSAVLPYSKKNFSVPDNLYIIGTMNTADRSVEALDTALRRRFCFVSMEPSMEPLNNKSAGNVALSSLLIRINERISVLLNSDHLIGHSYFIGITETEQLKSVFKNNIIPLMQEYFYNDYSKIGLVLGSEFVTAKPNSVQFPKNFEHENKKELAEGISYTLVPSDNWTEESFISIYQD